MHVLLLYPYLPSPHAAHGSARVVSRLLEGLRADARITLVCAFRPHEEHLLEGVRGLCGRLMPVRRPFREDLTRAGRLQERCTTALRFLATGYPVPAVKLDRSGLRRAVKAVLAEDPPDLVHVEMSLLARHGDLLRGVPSVLVEHDAEVPSGLRGLLWQRYRRRTFPAFQRVLALCAEDAAFLQRQVPGLTVGVRPPGVELPEGAARSPRPGRVLFTGSPHHGPNLDALDWLAAEVVPALRARCPGVVPVCAGIPADLPAARRAAAAGVELPGFVPDLAAELSSAAVVLAPVRRGRGVRIKNLEAMAHGVPLVTTPLGAAGFGDAAGRAFLAGRDAGELAAGVAELLEDPGRAATLGEAGRALVAERFTPEKQAAATLAVWREVAAGTT